jgi:hypothetical protein
LEALSVVANGLNSTFFESGVSFAAMGYSFGAIRSGLMKWEQLTSSDRKPLANAVFTGRSVRDDVAMAMGCFARHR